MTTAFAILFGAVALAGALAFGLGNTKLAGEVTREWYARYRAEREAHEGVTDSAEMEESLEAEAVTRPGGGLVEHPGDKRA